MAHLVAPSVCPRRSKISAALVVLLIRAVLSHELVGRLLPDRWRIDRLDCCLLGRLISTVSLNPTVSSHVRRMSSAARWMAHRLPSRFFHAARFSLDEVGFLVVVASLREKIFCLLLHILTVLPVAFLWWDSPFVSWHCCRCASLHCGALRVILAEATSSLSLE
jgi:hypothetical protein